MCHTATEQCVCRVTTGAESIERQGRCVEFRVPVLFNKAGAGIVQLAPFFDFGGAWDVDGSTSPTRIYSTGVGLLLAPCKYFSAQVYWGYRLRDVSIPDDSGLQGHGVDFRVNILAF